MSESCCGCPQQQVIVAPSNVVVTNTIVAVGGGLSLVSSASGSTTTYTLSTDCDNGNTAIQLCPGIHLGKDGTMKDFDGAWREVGAEYR